MCRVVHSFLFLTRSNSNQKLALRVSLNDQRIAMKLKLIFSPQQFSLVLESTTLLKITEDSKKLFLCEFMLEIKIETLKNIY